MFDATQEFSIRVTAKNIRPVSVRLFQPVRCSAQHDVLEADRYLVKPEQPMRFYTQRVRYF